MMSRLFRILLLFIGFILLFPSSAHAETFDIHVGDVDGLIAAMNASNAFATQPSCSAYWMPSLNTPMISLHAFSLPSHRHRPLDLLIFAMGQNLTNHADNMTHIMRHIIRTLEALEAL